MLFESTTQTIWCEFWCRFSSYIALFKTCRRTINSIPCLCLLCTHSFAWIASILLLFSFTLLFLRCETPNESEHAINGRTYIHYLEPLCMCMGLQVVCLSAAVYGYGSHGMPLPLPYTIWRALADARVCVFLCIAGVIAFAAMSGTPLPLHMDGEMVRHSHWREEGTHTQNT